MPYHSTDAYGISLINPTRQQMWDVISSLQEADDAEFPDVSLTHDTGWTLTYSAQAVLNWENLGMPTPVPLFRRNVSPEEVLALWERLSKGELSALKDEPWERGEE